MKVQDQEKVELKFTKPQRLPQSASLLLSAFWTLHSFPLLIVSSTIFQINDNVLMSRNNATF